MKRLSWCCVPALLLCACPTQQTPPVDFVMVADEEAVEADGVNVVVLTLTTAAAGDHTVKLTTTQGSFEDGKKSTTVTLNGLTNVFLTTCVYGVHGCGDEVEITAAIDRSRQSVTVIFDMASDVGSAWTAGTCGAFQPSAVYIHGTVTTDEGKKDAVIPLNPLADPCVGFPAHASGAAIRSDGKYAYLQDARVTLLAPDMLTYSDNVWHYPGATEANDTAVTTSACGSEAPGIQQVRAWPDTPRIAYQCTSTQDWFDEDGTNLTPAGEQLVALGRDGALLLLPESQHLVVRKAGQPDVELAELPSSVVAAHSTPTGFRVVLFEQDLTSLWSIPLAGTPVHDGDYATLSAPFAQAGACVMDALGGLYCPGTTQVEDGTERVQAVSLRRPDGNAQQLVFNHEGIVARTIDDPRHPLVTMENAFLVTGE